MFVRFSFFVRSVRKFSVILSVFIVFCVGDTLSSDFEPGGKPDVTLVNPDAEAVIGAVVNIRERGSGLFGCGERSRDGVVTADALRWMIDDLNKKIWSGTSANTSLGLYLMDSCGRTRTATSQLVQFLPELQSNENSTLSAIPFKFAIIDGVGLRNEVDILNTLDDMKVPVVEMNINTNSAQTLTNAVLLFMQELRVDRVAVVHTNSKFSTAMLKHLTKSLKKFDLCMPWVVNLSESGDEQLANVFRSGILVLSLLSSEEHAHLLKNLKDLTGSDKKVPIMFTDVVSREQLSLIPVNRVRVYSVIAYPEVEKSFEHYYSRNSLSRAFDREDELSIVERTQIVRRIKKIGEKISESLKSAIDSVCQGKGRLCPDLLAFEGRNAINDFLSEPDWSQSEQLYQLVEYQFQFSDQHVHLHKVMSYNNHKNLDVYENNFPMQDFNCESENEAALECRCLEMKSGRIGAARNIDDWGKKKQKQSKNNLEQVKNRSAFQVYEASVVNEPMVYSTLNDPVNGTLACLTLLGALVALVIAQYFATFAALPHGGLTAGTSIIGYVILLGLFLLFSTNLSFLLTPIISTCAIRRFSSNVSYAMIFSGMLIKIWTSLRQVNPEKPKTSKPFTLLSYSVAFTLLQAFLSGLWLLMKPPTVEYDGSKWVCYSPMGIDLHLLLSMIYPFVLLLVTIILAVRTCSKSNNDEARWILISSSLVAIILCCWGVAVGTRVWQMHRTASMNLAAGTILLVCLYIPKIKMHTKLKKTAKMHANTPPIPANIKECPVFTPAPPFPVVMGYNMVSPPPPVITEEIIDPSFVNQAYSIDETSETVSTPFDLDSSSYSELEQESYKFSTFLDEPQAVQPQQDEIFDDPTQVIPSNLYSIEMFNNEPIAVTSDHCQPGSNEFTPPHRATSQLYLCPQPEWVP